MEPTTTFALAHRINVLHGGDPAAAWDLAVKMLAGTDDLRSLFVECGHPSVGDGVHTAHAPIN